jgi:hypothetical protein
MHKKSQLYWNNENKREENSLVQGFPFRPLLNSFNVYIFEFWGVGSVVRVWSCNLVRQGSNSHDDGCKMIVSVTLINNNFPIPQFF